MQAQTRVWAAHTALVMRQTPARWDATHKVGNRSTERVPAQHHIDDDATPRVRQLQRLLVCGRTRNGGDEQP